MLVNLLSLVTLSTNSHLGQDDLAVRQCVEKIRRADSAKGLARSAKELLGHVQSVQDERRRRVEEQLLALKRERDHAQQRVRCETSNSVFFSKFYCLPIPLYSSINWDN